MKHLELLDVRTFIQLFALFFPQAHSTSKGCLRAARRLRSRLTSLVRVHRPESLASLSALCPDNPSDDAAGTSATTRSDDADAVMESYGAAEFRIGAD